MVMVLGKDLSDVFNVPQITSGPANPPHTFDSNSGYSVGDEYINTTSGTIYKCIGNAPGNAQWAPYTLGAPLALMADGTEAEAPSNGSAEPPPDSTEPPPGFAAPPADTTEHDTITRPT